MKSVKPSFYDRFHCIAGDCPLTCCQEWKITVDDETKERWENSTIPGQETHYLCEVITEREGEQVIRMDEDHRCPMLQKDGLCSLVLRDTDAATPKTCRLFPREEKKCADLRISSLDPGCPYVVELLKTWEGRTFLAEEKPLRALDLPDGGLPLLALRNRLLSLLDDDSLAVSDGLLIGFFVLLDLWERKGKRRLKMKDITGIDLCGIRKALLAAMDGMDFSREQTGEERNELVLDLICNYREAGLYDSFLKPLSELAEEMEEVPRIKADEELIRRFLLAESYFGLTLPEADLEGFILHYQWICMVYGAILHSIGLLGEEQVPSVLVYFSRMTGYTEEDIREFLENSFEEKIWEWGYAALVVGREPAES